nr:hypothetical protein [Variovorax sp. PAMC 28711]
MDDHPRVSFVQTHTNERKGSVAIFLLAAVAHYESPGVKINRLSTDNGSAYRSQLFAEPWYQPHLNQALPREDQWQGRAIHPDVPARVGYGSVWTNNAERTASLPAFLSYYNT